MKSLRPIRTKASYEAALKEVERLWGARSGTPAGDRLDILATLIEAYEDEHYPMDPPDPIDAIKFRMEQQGLASTSRASWVPGPVSLKCLMADQTSVSTILRARRGLFINMIRRLHERFGIPAEVLIRPTRRKRVA